MRIGYFADGPWSHNAFKLIYEDGGFDIRFICPRNDTEDSTLMGFADDCNIDYIRSPNINSPSFVQLVQSYDCDILVSMSFNQIFKRELIDVTRMGVINCHAGKLPYYRGRNILNWALINDEKEFGITVHFVDEGIDTGDIILQRTYPISDSDDYSTLLHRAYENCATILYDALVSLRSGNYERIQQQTIHPLGMYCGMRRDGDEILDWNCSSRQIYNFVRAICRPGPMARTWLNGALCKINKAIYFEDAPKYIGIPGQILRKDGFGIWVKTADSFIAVTDYEYDGKIRVGDRFEFQKG